MTNDAGVLLEAVTELARHAGELALQYFRPGIAREKKGDGSTVTEADRRTEQFAREWLAKRFPADGILGEEFGERVPGARRRWIIDPIDGTDSFVRHVPLWGTLVAVEESGKVIAGAASFPAVQELVAAAQGQGCWRNGTRTRVSQVDSLAGATVLTTDSRFRGKPHRFEAWNSLASQCGVARTWGDCYGYLMVATGRAEAMVDNIVNPWDAACMQPIIVEAGGVLTDFAGVPSPFNGSAIATNASLAAQIRGVLLDRQ